MNETVETNVQSEVQPEAPDIAVQSLVDTIDELATVVTIIQRALGDGLFKHLSKDARNKLFNGMLNRASDVHDATKAVFHLLKKIKREPLPDNIRDAMITGIDLTTLDGKSGAGEADE